MIRYSIEEIFSDAEMVEDKDGTYCKYRDALALETENAILLTAIKNIRSIVDPDSDIACLCDGALTKVEK